MSLTFLIAGAIAFLVLVAIAEKWSIIAAAVVVLVLAAVACSS